MNRKTAVLLSVLFVHASIAAGAPPCRDASGQFISCPPEVSYCRNLAGALVPCYSDVPQVDAPGAPAIREAPAAMDPTLPTVPVPEVEKIPGMDLEVSVGGVGAFTADTDGSLKAFARIRTITPLPIFNGGKNDDGTSKIAAKWNPRLGIRADFTGLPGRTVNIVDVTTFNSIEVGFGLAQPIFQSRYQMLAVYGEMGFATAMASGTNQPLDKTQRWFAFGVQLSQKQGKAWVKLGLGGDERIVSAQFYAFAAELSGSVRLWTEKAEGSAIKGVGVSLGGDATLGLGYGYLGLNQTRDLVRVWVAFSR